MFRTCPVCGTRINFFRFAIAAFSGKRDLESDFYECGSCSTKLRVWPLVVELGLMGLFLYPLIKLAEAISAAFDLVGIQSISVELVTIVASLLLIYYFYFLFVPIRPEAKK